MSLVVKKHPAERFLDWYPYNTRLYMRKKKGVEPHFSHDGKELFDQLVPFFDSITKPLEERIKFLEEELKRRGDDE